jgi:hypothetical protein
MPQNQPRPKLAVSNRAGTAASIGGVAGAEGVARCSIVIKDSFNSEAWGAAMFCKKLNPNIIIIIRTDPIRLILLMAQAPSSYLAEPAGSAPEPPRRQRSSFGVNFTPE